MNVKELSAFTVAGISVRTSNQDGRAARDIPGLWQRFMNEDIRAALQNRVDDTIYCVYTDYEKDHTEPYTAILGCKVDPAAAIGSEFVQITIPEGKFEVFTARGNNAGEAVFREWEKIWASASNRSFGCDFEVYGPDAWQKEVAQVDIFISIK